MTPRAVLTKFVALQMVDVHLPTTDGRHLILPHYTPPEQDRRLLLKKLRLELAATATAEDSVDRAPDRLLVVNTLATRR